jgi:glycosyltransferase involved in cell wall biosynthesis
MALSDSPPRTALLLSTFNGARYLRAQLDSLLIQTHTAWRLIWRDDGSSDETVAIMAAFAAALGPERCHCLAGSGQHLGPTASFMALLREAADDPAIDTVGFVDQDDVWLPEKLARGVAVLSSAVPDRPVLYCARQVLVDAGLRRLGLSGPLAQWPGFPASLTQNIATGCTVMLNRAALRLLARSAPAAASLHDWWCYLLVTASGGDIEQDAEPVILYRQHGDNLVGAPPSVTRRAMAAVRRGPAVFMGVLRQHVAALAAQPDLLSAEAQRDVARLDAALRGGWPARLTVLRLPGLHRQSRLETLVFRLWFLIG